MGQKFLLPGLVPPSAAKAKPPSYFFPGAIPPAITSKPSILSRKKQLLENTGMGKSNSVVENATVAKVMPRTTEETDTIREGECLNKAAGVESSMPEGSGGLKLLSQRSIAAEISAVIADDESVVSMLEELPLDPRCANTNSGQESDDGKTETTDEAAVKDDSPRKSTVAVKLEDKKDSGFKFSDLSHHMNGMYQQMWAVAATRKKDSCNYARQYNYFIQAFDDLMYTRYVHTDPTDKPKVRHGFLFDYLRDNRDLPRKNYLEVPFKDFNSNKSDDKKSGQFKYEVSRVYDHNQNPTVVTLKLPDPDDCCKILEALERKKTPGKDDPILDSIIQSAEACVQQYNAFQGLKELTKNQLKAVSDTVLVMDLSPAIDGVSSELFKGFFGVEEAHLRPDLDAVTIRANNGLSYQEIKAQLIIDKEKFESARLSAGASEAIRQKIATIDQVIALISENETPSAEDKSKITELLFEKLGGRYLDSSVYNALELKKDLLERRARFEKISSVSLRIKAALDEECERIDHLVGLIDNYDQLEGADKQYIDNRLAQRRWSRVPSSESLEELKASIQLSVKAYEALGTSHPNLLNDCNQQVEFYNKLLSNIDRMSDLRQQVASRASDERQAIIKVIDDAAKAHKMPSDEYMKRLRKQLSQTFTDIDDLASHLSIDLIESVLLELIELKRLTDETKADLKKGRESLSEDKKQLLRVFREYARSSEASRVLPAKRDASMFTKLFSMQAQSGGIVLSTHAQNRGVSFPDNIVYDLFSRVAQVRQDMAPGGCSPELEMMELLNDMHSGLAESNLRSGQMIKALKNKAVSPEDLKAKIEGRLSELSSEINVAEVPLGKQKLLTKNLGIESRSLDVNLKKFEGVFGALRRRVYPKAWQGYWTKSRQCQSKLLESTGKEAGIQANIESAKDKMFVLRRTLNSIEEPLPA